MKYDLSDIQHTVTKSNQKNSMQTYKLTSGMELSYHMMYNENLFLHHDSLSNVMEINYCHDGRMG